MIRLAVQVSTKSYTANAIKPPSAYRHRQADLEMLADTGSQADGFRTALQHSVNRRNVLRVGTGSGELNKLLGGFSGGKVIYLGRRNCSAELLSSSQ